MTEDTACHYVPIDEARSMAGVRVAFTRGVPGAWSVAIKAILEIKGIDYVPVAQDPGGPNEALQAWTGQTSAPVLMFNNDRPRANWSEMLVLAEQIQPEPRLLPADEDERIATLGLCHEICGEDGLGWNIRLLMLSGERAPPGTERNEGLRAKYISPVTNDYARQRVSAILDTLTRRLAAQAATGSRYLMTDRLTAPDIYWTAFSNLFAPMSEDLCTMPAYFRMTGPAAHLHLKTPVSQALIDHRDYIARTYFRTPIDI